MDNFFGIIRHMTAIKTADRADKDDSGEVSENPGSHDSPEVADNKKDKEEVQVCSSSGGLDGPSGPKRQVSSNSLGIHLLYILLGIFALLLVIWLISVSNPA